MKWLLGKLFLLQNKHGAEGERARGVEDASAPLGPRRRPGTDLGRRGWKPDERRAGSHPVQVGDESGHSGMSMPRLNPKP